MPPRTGQSRISYIVYSLVTLRTGQSTPVPDSRIYTNRLYRYLCCDTVSATRSCALWTRARPATVQSITAVVEVVSTTHATSLSHVCGVAGPRARGSKPLGPRRVSVWRQGRGGRRGAGGEVKAIRLGVTTAPFGPTSPEECGRSLLWSSYCSPFPWYWPVRTKIPFACA